VEDSLPLSFPEENRSLPSLYSRGISGAKESQILMTRGNILLVDDDPGFLTALTKTLTKHGYAVTTAAEAAGAVEATADRKQKFDIVITDLSMPKISGLTVLRAVKGAFPGVEVIVITAFGDQETEEKAMRQGAFAFVQKPLDPEKFLSLITSAMKTENRNI
jgi:DNA-binding NtrC family response regulator